jgi:hypothetical protein
MVPVLLEHHERIPYVPTSRPWTISRRCQTMFATTPRRPGSGALQFDSGGGQAKPPLRREYAVRVAGKARNKRPGSQALYYAFGPSIPAGHPARSTRGLWFFFETLAQCWPSFVANITIWPHVVQLSVQLFASGDPTAVTRRRRDACGNPSRPTRPTDVFGDEGPRFVKKRPGPVMNFRVDTPLKD